MHKEFFHLEGEEYEKAHDQWNQKRLERFLPSVEFLNYTPHPITLRTSLNLQITFESRGSARVKESQKLLRTVKPGIELRQVEYGEIEGLPEFKENQLVIVSFLVKQANALLENPRTDLISPDTGASCIRENGQIKFVTGFLV